MWSENIASRGSNEVGSCILNLCSSVTHLIAYSVTLHAPEYYFTYFRCIDFVGTNFMDFNAFSVPINITAHHSIFSKACIYFDMNQLVINIPLEVT